MGQSAMQNVVYVLAGTLVLLFVLLLYYKRRADGLADRLAEEKFRRRSLSTVYGQINEQWFPLMEAYPYDSQFFRFLGSPVDGVQFEEDRIIICEFKTNTSSLSPVQKRIKQLIESKRVYWEEFNFMSEG
jgi:predicted Holliday junction resolvase-like endonuclease